MAHTVIWPKKKFFYPIGNTPPISFTADVPVEAPAAILLLGCGDPRSILYTIYAEPNDQRNLDMTCCDAEPAILARNVLLFTMIVDEDNPEIIQYTWNMFFHFYLDNKSLDRLQKQCQKLVDLSISVESWDKGKYAKLLRFCSVHTLAELRRQWLSYLATKDLPDSKLREAFQTGMQSVKDRLGNLNITTATRSAGPVWAYLASAGADNYQHFWDTGVTFDDADHISAATNINPTFAYDSSGRGFNVHYGTDPILAFHLGIAAKLPLSPQHIPSASDLVGIAKEQFSEWCKAFRKRVIGSHNIVIRLCVGDALAFSRALHVCTSTNCTASGLYCSAWEDIQINLDGGGYSENDDEKDHAPVQFDIIETSNLTDHLGLVNILVATLPLLQRHPWAALYTNTLLAPEEVGGDFTHRMCADIATLSLLLGIVPVSYTSNFATQTNTHEGLSTDKEGRPRQETISWKRAPTNTGHQPLQMEAKQLGSILFNIYLRMFADEDLSRLFKKLPKHKFGFIHYNRSSFALLLVLVRQRIGSDWAQAFAHMISLIEQDKILLTGRNYFQDLCCQLYVQNLYTVHAIAEKSYGGFLPRIFNDWEHIPPVACVVLKVPRKKLQAMEAIHVDDIGTPILQCEIDNTVNHNFFSDIHLSFGTTRPSVSDPHCLLLTEDINRWSGKSTLIVSFYVPSWMLTVQTPGTYVRLSVRPGTALTSAIYSVLGPQLRLFSANLLDRNHVQVVRDRPSNLQELKLMKLAARSSDLNSGTTLQAHWQVTTKILTNADATMANGLTGKVIISDPSLQTAFRACPLADIQVKQTAPFSMLVSFGMFHHVTLTFPYPVNGNTSKARIARSSSYIEVDVGLCGASADGLIENPFPMVNGDLGPIPWNIHHINLDKAPKLDMSNLQWLASHLLVTLSDAEYASNKTLPKNKRGLITDIKHTINEIFSVASSARESTQVFVIRHAEKPRHGILIILNCLRLDLPSHTLVADTCVVPMTPLSPEFETISRCMITRKSPILVISASSREIRAWWQLLPVLAERCRDWSHSATCKFRTVGVPDVPDMDSSPLCGCGRGKSVPPSFLSSDYKRLAPLVTRVALGLLFPVSYLESIGGCLREELDRCTPDVCDVCSGLGQPRLMQCSVCARAKYCSKDCQKKGWKNHRAECKKSKTA